MVRGPERASDPRVRLAAEERAELSEKVRRGKLDRSEKIRARILLLCDGESGPGLSMKTVAARLGVTVQTVTSTNRKYFRGGVNRAILRELKRPVRLTAEERGELSEKVRRGKLCRSEKIRARILLLCDRGESGPGLSRETVAARLGVTVRTVTNTNQKYFRDGLNRAILRDRYRGREKICGQESGAAHPNKARCPERAGVKHPVRLTAEERAELSEKVRRGWLDRFEKTRARILLLCDCGEGGPGLRRESVAKRLGVTIQTVTNTNRRFCRNGVNSAVVRENYRQGPKKIYGQQFEADLRRLLACPPPKNKARWTGRLLAEKMRDLGYSASHATVNRILSGDELRGSSRLQGAAFADAVEKILSAPPPGGRSRWTVGLVGEKLFKMGLAPKYAHPTLMRLVRRNGLDPADLESSVKQLRSK